jgi:DNA repair protein RadC
LELNAAAVISSPTSILRDHRAVQRGSHADRATEAALALIDVRVLDHIIVGQGTPYSFAESGLL